jgi:4-hydroxy-tetrahydrodipicolinate reductase
MSSPLRIFQVASGNVGTEMIRRIQKHPDLELVGLHCYSPDKVGRDVGEIADIESVTCIESVDVSCHHSAETWENCGFGRPVDDPEVPRLLELGTRVFEDGVRLMADCLDIKLTPHTDPHWDIQGCYITKIDGDPCIYSKHMVSPASGRYPQPTDTDFASVDAFAKIGMTVTGMPALNSIRAVVDAPPGIVTSADLPLRAFAGRFTR